MDAVPLIEDTRRALAHSKEASDIVGEAWQAQALAEAVGVHLVLTGPPEVRTQAGGLREAGGRACCSLRAPGQRAEDARAARLTGIDDLLSALHGLGGLLDETGGALVGLAVEAEEEALYWRCIEGIDAADECGDRVAAILRRLALRPAPPAQEADAMDAMDAVDAVDAVDGADAVEGEEEWRHPAEAGTAGACRPAEAFDPAGAAQVIEIIEMTVAMEAMEAPETAGTAPAADRS